MMLRNGDFLFTHPAEVLKQFYIMKIVFHLSLLGILYKWKKWQQRSFAVYCLLPGAQMICGNLKVVGLVLWPQGGYTKYTYFLCLGNGRTDD